MYVTVTVLCFIKVGAGIGPAKGSRLNQFENCADKCA